jgi:uncharacterized membrane protein
MEIKYIKFFKREIVGVFFVLVVGKLWMSTGAFWKMVLENLIPMV